MARISVTAASAPAMGQAMRGGMERVWARPVKSSTIKTRKLISAPMRRLYQARWRASPRPLLLGRGLLLAELLDHLLLGRARHRLILGELHGVLALALRRGAEVRRVAEHFAQGHVRVG